MTKFPVEVCCSYCSYWFPLPVLFDEGMLMKLDGTDIHCPKCESRNLVDRQQVRYAPISVACRYCSSTCKPCRCGEVACM